MTDSLYIDEANSSLCTEISDLLRLSFKERLDSGLNFTCAHFSPDDVKSHIEGKYLFTVRDSDSLIAMMTLSKTKGSGHMEYVAVHPDYKGKGLASRLYKYMEDCSKSLDIKVLTSTTACKADSSVYWHKKMGFLIYGLGSDNHTNYYSYLLKKTLCGKIKWNNRLYVKLSYILYYMAVHIGKKKNGDLTILGRLLLKIKKLLGLIDKNIYSFILLLSVICTLELIIIGVVFQAISKTACPSSLLQTSIPTWAV